MKNTSSKPKDDTESVFFVLFAENSILVLVIWSIILFRCLADSLPFTMLRSFTATWNLKTFSWQLMDMSSSLILVCQKMLLKPTVEPIRSAEQFSTWHLNSSWANLTPIQLIGTHSVLLFITSTPVSLHTERQISMVSLFSSSEDGRWYIWMLLITFNLPSHRITPWPHGYHSFRKGKTCIMYGRRWKILHLLAHTSRSSRKTRSRNRPP